MDNFIYTDSFDAYDALTSAGFPDAGYFEHNGKVTYALINMQDLSIPDKYKKSCVVSSKMFMSPLKGGDIHGRHIK